MDHSNQFLQWLKDSDAFISSKIDIKDYSEEGSRLGVVALEDIKVIISLDKKSHVVPYVCRRMKYYSLYLVNVSCHVHHQNSVIKSERRAKSLAGFR